MTRKVFKSFPLLIARSPHYNDPMFSRLLTLFTILILMGFGLPHICNAQSAHSAAVTDEEDPNVVNGFAPPYEYEREANGYDPEGVEYKENKVEDFQVVFITATPFTAFASFGVWATIGLFTNGTFTVGDNFWYFVGTALAGSTTVACVSVLSNNYPPPHQTTFSDNSLQPKALAFVVPLLTAQF